MFGALPDTGPALVLTRTLIPRMRSAPLTGQITDR
jgi:hypothetical protein